MWHYFDNFLLILWKLHSWNLIKSPYFRTLSVELLSYWQRHPYSHPSRTPPHFRPLSHAAACKTIYIRKTIYFAYAKLYVLYKVYTFAYGKYMFCITYEKLYILNKKRRAFHEEAPTTKITTDTAFVFCVWWHVAYYFLKGYMLRRGVLGFTNAV